MTRTLRIMPGAIIAGTVVFTVLYLALALSLVFALSLLQDFISGIWIERVFKLLGLLALLFCGYVAARIARRNGVLHGLLTGAAVSLVSVLFLMLTFSWEAHLWDTVGLAIVKIATLGLLMGGLGGWIGEWRNRRRTMGS
ncbi:MAG: hypothetical protein RQ736_03205 [Thiogranum sp.]|nr:hypothetical protein [Thiogranum sp.]